MPALVGGELALREGVGKTIRRLAVQAFGNLNAWITHSVEFVAQMGATDYHADTDLTQPDGGVAAVNLTAAPFLDDLGDDDPAQHGVDAQRILHRDGRGDLYPWREAWDGVWIMEQK
jgi:hypothetical protein